ncbi:MAG TPA: alpha/beta hydrolase [Trebonia sp.]|nr:alpha/beta hydrolase [Trebonia sp.]
MTEQLPLDVIAQLTALDPEITPDLVVASWAALKPYHEKAGYTAPKIDRDLRYGDHERHRLDVHTSGDQANAPVFVFVHGGGFIGGDKHVPGSPQYDYLGAWAVRNGWVGVTMTYRLAPGHTWPSGAQDVAEAIAWIRDNIADYGGDPDRIVVAGNSAGAVHVASYVTGQGGGSLAGVRGAAILSGFYEVSLAERSALEHAYYGDTPAEDAATLDGLVSADLPLLFSVAERDPLFFQTQAARLVAAWFAAHHVMPNMVWVAGHNHISGIGSVGVDDAALGAPLARFITRVTA